jgi:acetyl-CoA carboxylase biotin carboxyl carrier protein
VNVGSHVEAGQVVGLVEVMKLFNEVKAPAAGEIVAVLAEDGEMVEYGQPLFQLKRA